MLLRIGRRGSNGFLLCASVRPGLTMEHEARPRGCGGGRSGSDREAPRVVGRARIRVTGSIRGAGANLRGRAMTDHQLQHFGPAVPRRGASRATADGPGPRLGYLVGRDAAVVQANLDAAGTDRGRSRPPAGSPCRPGSAPCWRGPRGARRHRRRRRPEPPRWLRPTRRPGPRRSMWPPPRPSRPDPCRSPRRGRYRSRARPSCR